MLSPQVKNELLDKVKLLSNDITFKEKVEKDREALKDMLSHFPFRQNPT